MVKYPLSENAQEFAEQLFCSQRAYKSLQQPIDSKENVVTYNDLVQLVMGNEQPSFQQRIPYLMRLVNENESLRKNYTALVNKLSFAFSGVQIAASSADDTLLPRVTEQFTIKFKRDKTFLTQVYVILSIAHPAEKHHNRPIALHISQGMHIDCVYFPALEDGRSQLLLEENDTIFQLLICENSTFNLM